MTRYEYDCQHRLIKVIKPTGIITTYSYDPFNRCTRKTVNGKTTEFIWQGNKLIAETDNDKHWQSYIYEPDSFRPLALIKGNTQQDKIQCYWYQNDQLGTPIRLTDSIGETLYQCEYNAYGQVIDENYYCDNIDTLPDNPLRFQGQYYDEESDLHYNLNRYYDPFVGRYITQDPLGILGGLNAYQYCQNPVNWIDPLGLFNTQNNGFEALVGKEANQVGNGNLPIVRKGKVTYEALAKPDANEIRAGQGFADLGYDVTYVATASEKGIKNVRTQGLWISGIGKVDVITPKIITEKSMLRRIEGKIHKQQPLFFKLIYRLKECKE